MNNKILLFKSFSDNADQEAVKNIIKRGTWWAEGPEIEEFENKFAQKFNRKYAIALNSGTSALHTNLMANNITKGEVIVPSFTFAATPNSVIAAGASPIFADIEKETFGLSKESVLENINKNTKAIMPINFAGNISKDIIELKKIADEHNITLIEDNAHSIGAKLNETYAGNFGSSACFSFCFNKILTTGEGGMILTNSKEVYNKAKIIRAHGGSKEGKKDYTNWGYNFRMPTMCAALGLSQLNKLDFIINKRREMAQFLKTELKDISQINFPKIYDNTFCVYQLFNILLEDQQTRDKLQMSLKEKGIPTRVTYTPLHKYTFYNDYFKDKNLNLQNTEEISKKILSLPFHLGLSQDNLNQIVNSIKESLA